MDSHNVTIDLTESFNEISLVSCENLCIPAEEEEELVFLPTKTASRCSTPIPDDLTFDSDYSMQEVEAWTLATLDSESYAPTPASPQAGPSHRYTAHDQGYILSSQQAGPSRGYTQSSPPGPSNNYHGQGCSHPDFARDWTPQSPVSDLDEDMESSETESEVSIPEAQEMSFGELGEAVVATVPIPYVQLRRDEESAMQWSWSRPNLGSGVPGRPFVVAEEQGRQARMGTLAGHFFWYLVQHAQHMTQEDLAHIRRFTALSHLFFNNYQSRNNMPPRNPEQ